MEVDINWLAILAGTAASMFSGMIWYHPKVFGTIWMKAIGMTPKQAEKDQIRSMVIAIVRSVVLSFSLFHIIFVTDYFYSGSSFLVNALGVGVWVGIGIVAFTMLMHDTFEQRPKMATKIHTSYEIANILLVSGVIGLVAG